MRKSVKNCRKLNMQTIRVRRSRPSSPAIALALAITMLAVYLLTLQAVPEETAEAAAVRSFAEIRMEGMETDFLISSVHDDETQARVSSAICAQNGGAGLILAENGQYAVVHSAGETFSDSDGMVIHRGVNGLSLKIDAPIDIVTAMSDGISALRALAVETGGFASSLEAGETDQRTVHALLEVYRTQLENSLQALDQTEVAEIVPIRRALQDNLERVQLSLEETDAGSLRMLHAGAQMNWIALLEGLREMA